MIRNIESILALASADLVLLPSAQVLARATFEIGLKAAWMIEPSRARLMALMASILIDQRGAVQSCLGAD